MTVDPLFPVEKDIYSVPYPPLRGHKMLQLPVDSPVHDRLGVNAWSYSLVQRCFWTYCLKSVIILQATGMITVPSLHALTKVLTVDVSDHISRRSCMLNRSCKSDRAVRRTPGLT
jgi:hypothetical protein